MHKCPHCEYKSKEIIDLKRHINNKHNLNPKIHSCPLCILNTKK